MAEQDDDQAKRRAVNNLLAQLMPNKSNANHKSAHAPGNPSQSEEMKVPEKSEGQENNKENTTTTANITSSAASNTENSADSIPQNGVAQTAMDQQIEAEYFLKEGGNLEGMHDSSDPLLVNATDPTGHGLLNHATATDSNQPFPNFPFAADTSVMGSFDASSPNQNLEKEDIPDHMRKPAERGQIEAFAKLEFSDGNYYITTHSCELGRDVLALRAAEAREQSSGSQHAKSSSGRASHSAANRVKRDESGMVGSVVSERGGFCGLDDNQQEKAEAPPHSSMSGSDVVKPEDLHLNTSKQSFDYAAAAEILDDNERPRPVDAQALLPPTDQNPLIPIHPTAGQDGAEEIAAHKSISRRHVRISWNFDQNFFELIILGRNGAFLNGRWHAQGVALPLDHGAQIQIGGVQIKFKLPMAPAVDDAPTEFTDGSVMEDGMDQEDGEDEDEEVKDSIENDDPISKTKSVPKIKFIKKGNPPKKPDTKTPTDSANPDQPAKRRGPGRPPKDGIMSNRERKEIEKAKKAAAAREANGGVTPPPTGRAKVPKPKESTEDPDAPKTEKRKYTKRKRADGSTEADGAPNGEAGEDEEEGDEEGKPLAKKARQSKSPSPPYPSESSFTEEQLAKPPYNYTVLIFEALQESSKPLGLRQIYRALKTKYPYFVHRCPTDGWQSSVRHNLNGDRNLFMHADRDGKGWTWKLVPGAVMEKEKKRKPEPVERPENGGPPRYPPPGPRPPGQPYGAPYPSYPPYAHGAPPPPGYYPPPNMTPGQYPPPGSFGYPGQPPQQQMGPPPTRGSATPAPPGSASSPPVQSGMGILKPSPAPPAPQPFHAAGSQPPNRQQQPSPQSRPSAPPTNKTAPQQPQSAKLDPMLPCTPEGLYTIQNFEYAIYADTPSPEEREKLRNTFGSVRARVLGGRKQSLLAGGETENERVLLGHVQKIVERFPNPIYNAEMVKRREEDRARLEAETKAKAQQGQNGPNGSASSTPVPQTDNGGGSEKNQATGTPLTPGANLPASTEDKVTNEQAATKKSPVAESHVNETPSASTAVVMEDDAPNDAVGGK